MRSVMSVMQYRPGMGCRTVSAASSHEQAPARCCRADDLMDSDSAAVDHSDLVKAAIGTGRGIARHLGGNCGQ